MPNIPRRAPQLAAAAAALLIVFAATWIVLDRTEDRPGWLLVEAPETAFVGRTLEVRVALKKSVGPAMINCTLFRANANRQGWGFLASSGPSRPAAGGGSYVFVFDVPDRGQTAFAFPLVFLSPTGQWEDATHAATAVYMPVLKDGPAAAEVEFRKKPVYRYPTPAEAARTREREARALPRGRPSVWVHPALGVLLFAAAAFAAAKARRLGAGAKPGRGGERQAWLILAVLLAAGAMAELTGIAGHVAAWGRRLAEAGGVYESRKGFQKTVMAALAAASLGLFLLFIRAVRRSGADRHLLWAGIGLADYLAVSFVSALSFHAVDAARGIFWHGVSPVDAARGAGVVVALLAAAVARRRDPGGSST